MKDTVGEIAVSSLRDVISVVWLSNQVEQPERAAEHGLAVDGAVRPQDRSFLKAGSGPWLPQSIGAPPLKRRPLGACGLAFVLCNIASYLAAGCKGVTSVAKVVGRLRVMV
jgi:hypothetical protein